jgi:hypothetical protein
MALTTRQAILTSNLTVYFQTGADNVKVEDHVINGVDETVNFNSASTPDVDSAPYSKILTLSGGTDNIDLYDGLVDPEGNALSLNGKKVRAVKFQAPTTNTGNVTITEAASNGYELLGDAFKMILTPGQSVLVYCENDAPTISSTVTNIAYSGTLNDKLKVVAIFG